MQVSQGPVQVSRSLASGLSFALFLFVFLSFVSKSRKSVNDFRFVVSGPPQVLLGTGLIYFLALGDNPGGPGPKWPLGAQGSLTLNHPDPHPNHEPKSFKPLMEQGSGDSCLQAPQ